MIISGKDYRGKICRLVHKGAPVRRGDVLEHRGERYRITGGRPPHKEGSTGRVWYEEISTGFTGEFFPSVFDCEWEEM